MEEMGSLASRLNDGMDREAAGMLSLQPHEQCSAVVFHRLFVHTNWMERGK